MIERRVDNPMHHISAAIIVVRVPSGRVGNDAFGEELESNGRSEHYERLPNGGFGLNQDDDRRIYPEQHERERSVA